MNRGFEALRIGALLLVVAVLVTSVPAGAALLDQRHAEPWWFDVVLVVGLVVATGLGVAGARDARTVRAAGRTYAATALLGTAGLVLGHDGADRLTAEPWIHHFVVTAVGLTVLVCRDGRVSALVAATLVGADAWLHATVWATPPPGLAYHLALEVAIFCVGALLLAAATAEQQAERAEAEALAERFLDARAAEQLGRRGAQWDALVHDDILAALETIARGAPDSDDRVVAEQALDSLDAGPPTGAMDSVAFRAAVLETMLAESPAATSRFVTSSDACPLPPDVADALLLALTEALRNAAVHAYPRTGQGEVSVQLDHGDDHLTVTVADRGVGFERARVGRTSFGVALSIEGRMGAVGGTGSVTSRPGAGTTVSLRWTPGGHA